jgi:hypothetical protein
MFNEQSSVENGSETRFFPLGSECHGSQALRVSRRARAKKNRVSSGFLTSHLEHRMPYRQVVLRQKPVFFSWD